MTTHNGLFCCFGEVLWDMFPSGKQPGGAPMNVAAHLQKQGLQTAMISSIGTDGLGQEIETFMHSLGLDTSFIQHNPNLPTGTVQVDISDASNAVYTIVHPVAWDDIQHTPELDALVANASVFIYGSLAARNAVSFQTLQSLLQKAAFKVFDVNLRAPHYGTDTLHTLLSVADIVKMNDDELAIIVPQGGTESEKMQFLYEKYGLKLLIVTKGGDGAACWDSNGLHTFGGHQVTVVDTVGSGDAFLAGFLKQFFDGQSADYALRYACALGALVATHRGANPVITPTALEGLMATA